MTHYEHIKGILEKELRAKTILRDKMFNYNRKGNVEQVADMSKEIVFIMQSIVELKNVFGVKDVELQYYK